MKSFLGLALAFLLSACVVAPTESPALAVPVGEPILKSMDFYMEWVCETIHNPCEGIQPPTLVYTELLSDLAPPGLILFGMTIRGEPYLYINSKSGRGMPAIEATVVHEMVHYILFHVSPTLDDCSHEFIARLITAKWSGIAYDDRWRKNYDCEVTPAIDPTIPENPDWDSYPAK